MKKIKTNNTDTFPIVAIGASAGGLEALAEFFKAMPENKGLAFIVVVHLDPDHSSLLPELLQKHTAMRVVQIIDAMLIKINTVYIIPPDKSLSIINRKLYLVKMELPRFNHLPIDSFFKSLAKDVADKAIGIILSGTGSDGTQGIKEIKAEGGLILVQDELSAKYDAMPRNAIATGLVDYILPPQAMPDKLITYIKYPNSVKALAISQQEQSDTILQKIYLLIRNKTGHDFSLYKKNTIYRRIERRMHLHQIENIPNYFFFLQKNESEISLLAKELLIGVTSFFRDPEAYNVLLQQILPQSLADKPNNYTLRVWTAGCSTGEEAYSIAILLQEYLDTIDKHFNIQIFGTDLDNSSIESARRGIYPASICADISSTRLNRFFSKQNGYFKIKKSIREMVVFAVQNIVKDPPFTKLDMITCRNLLIYFSPELQNKILPIFHYSLKENGILFLGSSETTGQSNNFFTILDKKWKLFSRNKLPDNSLRNTLKQAQLNDSPMKLLPVLPNLIQRAEELSMMQLVEAILRQSNTPPCVIIDNNKDIIYIHGKLGKYLEPAEGRISINLLDMVRFGLKSELTVLIRAVIQTNKTQQSKACSFNYEGHSSFVDLTVKTITEQALMSGLLMVIFEELPIAAITADNINADTISSKDIALLQRELNNTKENLQSTIEELETAIEELKSTNEELQSTNEELQSTNEELETSKEELQSLNEEAVTINSELQCRIDDYQIINDDMKNLFDSTQIATIFLDTKLQIRRFTPKVKEIIQLVLSDIGRPISHFASSLLNTNLSELADNVLKTLEKHESEIYNSANHCFLVRIMPYRTLNNVIDGVVLTFDNITERKAIELALINSEHRYKRLFDYCPLAIWVENFAEIENQLTQLRAQGILDLKAYLIEQIDFLETLMTLTQFEQLNTAALRLFNASNYDELLLNMPRLLNQNNTDNFIAQLMAIWEQKPALQLNYNSHDYQGKPLSFSVDWTIAKHLNKLDYSNTISVLRP